MPRSEPSPRPWSRRAEAVAAVGFWLTLGALSVLRRAMDPRHPDGIPLGDIIETMAEYGIWALLTPLVFWVASRWGAEREAWTWRLSAQLLVGAGLAVAVEAVTRGVLRPLLSTPGVTGPPAGFEWTLAGAVRGLWFLDEFVIFLAVLAVGYARAALAQARRRQAEADRLLADRARLEAQLTAARLSALRMQLNPHFLFNTLNAVSALVERDPAGVRTMIARLSSLLRRVLDDDGATEVALRDELAFLRDYLDVQRVRFQGRLTVEEDVPPALLDARVPPLLLQPLVENAVDHGVRRLEDGVGVIRLAARAEDGTLVLTVADNGPGLSAKADRPGTSSGGVGVANTRGRLAGLYGAEGTLEICEPVAGGVVAEVTLPLRLAPDAGGDGAVERPVPGAHA